MVKSNSSTSGTLFYESYPEYRKKKALWREVFSDNKKKLETTKYSIIEERMVILTVIGPFDIML